MTIIGRITKDATVTTIAKDKKVVNFSIAVNDYYKPKGKEKGITVTNYFNCSYWLSPNVAKLLTKGSLVELIGRIGVSAYTDREGNAKASLNFHVNDFTLHHFVKADVAAQVEASNEPIDDLPF